MSDIENFDIRKHVVDSIVEVFDTMVSMEVELFDAEPPESTGKGRMVATVNFAGNVIGLINIQVSSELSRLMMASMLGIEPEEVEDEGEAKDLLAEINNIVGGNLKSALNDAGHHCVISTPSITYGADFTIKSLQLDRFERFVFSCRENYFFVEVGIKTQQATGEEGELGTPDALRNLSKIDIQKINALDINAQVSEAIIGVFDTMLSLNLEPTDAVTAKSLEGVRYVGSVSFAGDATGMVSIHAGENFAREMAAEMLGMDPDEIEGDEEIRDMMGEMGNIVGGNLKSAFTDAGLICALSTPSFTSGTDFKIEALNMEKYERFAFHCGQNIIFVEMGVKVSELVQAESKQGKDIHYSVKEEDADKAAETESSTGVKAPEKTVKTPPVEEKKEEIAATPERSTGTEPPKAPVNSDETQAPPDAPPDPREKTSQEDVDLNLLLDIPLEIKVELGRAKIPIRKLLNLAPGSAVKLVKLDGDPVDILVNGTLIARGEVIVQNEKYGIRVTEITSRMDRIRSFSI